MTAGSHDHGFTRVDELPRPGACVECLDLVHGHPFYRAYKGRVREILRPRSNRLYLEVGAGAGTDARIPGVKVIALDKSLTMCREARGAVCRWSSLPMQTRFLFRRIPLTAAGRTAPFSTFATRTPRFESWSGS